jgi:hypothetical protein
MPRHCGCRRQGQSGGKSGARIGRPRVPAEQQTGVGIRIRPHPPGGAFSHGKCPVDETKRGAAAFALGANARKVYYWGALAGKRRGLRFDPELLYAGAMFHDMGLTDQHSSADEPFEVDGANAARDFLRLTRRSIEPAFAG